MIFTKNQTVYHILLFVIHFKSSLSTASRVFVVDKMTMVIQAWKGNLPKSEP